MQQPVLKQNLCSFDYPAKPLETVQQLYADLPWENVQRCTDADVGELRQGTNTHCQSSRGSSI